MSTTLPLFWHLSSAKKKDRIDASVKLVAALEHFQSSFVPTPKPQSDEDDENEDEDEDEDDDEPAKKPDGLDALNAPDVSYSLRRLIRGLASPRESSRLGFAVALTELLSRLTTVSCAQAIQLILDASHTHGSMSGHEERDVLFARLFGLTAVVQSGLLVRPAPPPSSSSSSSSSSPNPNAAPADLDSYTALLTHLLALGDRKAWLRESAWWALARAVRALAAAPPADVPWRADAVRTTLAAVYDPARPWTPEKLALTLVLRAAFPDSDAEGAWRARLAPVFGGADVFAPRGLVAVAKIMKESEVDTDEDADTKENKQKGGGAKAGPWKPQLHFVWDMLLEQVLPQPDGDGTTACRGSFAEFFRIVVDESLFAATASAQRKYWGFQVFQRALPRVSADELPMLFTRNFMRSWINHLADSDRYLHKAARQVATDIQALVKHNPALGFALVLQLTGAHGSRQFDRLTRTKTVEGVLAAMDERGIERYIEYLVGVAGGGEDSPAQTQNAAKDPPKKDTADATTHAHDHDHDARRTWAADQLAALVRNGAVPRGDAWLQAVLDWLVVHGLFVVRKSAQGSAFKALHSVPRPAFSDALQAHCRERLLACLADLTGQTTRVKEDTKAAKAAAVAADGRFWVSRVLATIDALERDAKHVRPLFAPAPAPAGEGEGDGEAAALRAKARGVLTRLHAVRDDDSARGAELLLGATLVQVYCAQAAGPDADVGEDVLVLESCIDAAERMFPPEKALKKGKAKANAKDKRKGKDKGKEKEKEAAGGQDGEQPAPVDVLVDAVIGFLEKGTAYMRAVANQGFALLAGAVQASTIDHILTQLERRDPDELVADEDVEMDDAEDGASSESSEDADADDAAEEDEDEEANMELRRKLEDALRVKGPTEAEGSGSDSDEELMDDDQMLAIDEQLAAAFKARAAEKRQGKDVDAQREATHFKNRVLDLLDLFLKKQPASALAPRLVLPLVELVVSTGPDEQQLADKAAGVLRARLGKARDVPHSLDAPARAAAAHALAAVHVLARKAAAPEVLATLAQCSLYLAKVLLLAASGDAREGTGPDLQHQHDHDDDDQHEKEEEEGEGKDAAEAVLDAYRASLHDFATRKASRLNIAFFEAFAKRQPQAAWRMRADVLRAASAALNGFRQAQVFRLVQTLVNQLQALGDSAKPDALAFMRTLRDAMLDALARACADEAAPLQPAHAKDVLRLALSAVRQTRRLDARALAEVWLPARWAALADAMAGAERFRASVGLQAMCRQIGGMVLEQEGSGAGGKVGGKGKDAGQKKEKTGARATKRKVGDRDGDGEEAEADEEAAEGGKKARRKKARKAKAA